MPWKKAHFIGIAGKGMSATALLLKQQGVAISGSDEGFYPPVSDYLRAAQIPFSNGYRAENIPPDVDVIVIGKNAKLVPEGNAEVAAAFESGKKIVSFADVLSRLTERTDNIVVAGSYGKSTCTALLAHCLVSAKKDPSYFIGEVTKGFETYARQGNGTTFVLEGDEYPSANWDATSKFLHYHAHSVLLTSATHDHVNIFKTHEDYLVPFGALVSALQPDDVLVVGDEPFARKIAGSSPGRNVFYSLSDMNGWHPSNIIYGKTSTFTLMNGGERVVELSTSLLGAHNVENIVGVSSMLLEKKLLTPEDLATGVASFQGVRRRMELLTNTSRVPAYEGFGSSYEKAKSAIAAMKLHFPQNRLVVVFEPHTFSWRNREKIEWYDSVFAGADEVLVYHPAEQGSTTHAQLSHNEIVERVRTANISVQKVITPVETMDALSKTIRDDDVILVLTSGGMDGLVKKIPTWLDSTYA